MNSFVICTFCLLRDGLYMKQERRRCNRNGTVFAQISEYRKPLGTLPRRWKDNNRTDIVERGREALDRLQLAQDRVQWREPLNTVMILRAV
jgi:hypothetical protein